MKAVCIIGSPRVNGSTAFLVHRIAEGLRDEGVDVQYRSLGQMNIQYCKGCKDCEKTQHCVQRDDMDILINDIFDSDIIVLASPSYWGEVTGQMKVFFDRSTALCNAKTAQTIVPSGKIGIGVAVRAGNSQKESQHILDTFQHYFGHLNIEMKMSISVEGVDALSDMKQKTKKLKEAYDLGRKAIHDIPAAQ